MIPHFEQLPVLKVRIPVLISSSFTHASLLLDPVSPRLALLSRNADHLAGFIHTALIEQRILLFVFILSVLERSVFPRVHTSAPTFDRFTPQLLASGRAPHGFLRGGGGARHHPPVPHPLALLLENGYT